MRATSSVVSLTRPAPPGHSAVTRIAAIGAIEDVRPASFAVRLDDLIAAVERAGEDHADVGRACERIHHTCRGLRDDVVWGAKTILEVSGGVRAVHVP